MAKIKEAPAPGNDVYTGLLALSLVAMIIGCVLLYIDYGVYGDRTPPPLPRLDVPGAVKQQAAPAQPRVAPETKAEEKKDGASRPAPVQPDLTLPKLPAAVAEAKPEPARLPDLTRPDANVKPAVAYVPALPTPTGDEPPVLVKPFTPAPTPPGGN